MTAIVASAPGKVVLSGEYAVLDGAPAICMAVNRRAGAVVTEFDGQWHRVTAPGNTTVEGRFLMEGALPNWLQGEAEYGLVDAVLRTTGKGPAGPLSIELNTRAFTDTHSGKKFGLGSSAALTAALLAALGKSDDVLVDAMKAHRLFQQGAGSGVDIAAAVYGGLIEYRMANSRVSNLEWPVGLCYRLLWTGITASTRSKLEKLGEAVQRESRERLAESAAAMAEAWRSADAVLSEYPDYIEDLRRFSVDHGLGIFDAGHDRLVTEAAAAGLVYKPCGAGGGDIGVLLGRSNQGLDDFMAGRDRPIQCELDPHGVELEQR